MADADEAREIDLIRQYPDLKADILKVGHHGSATSTSAEFLSRIQVRMALISVGYNNYGHPSWLTLDRLKNQYVSVMTTRDEGDLMFVFIKGFTGLSTSLSKLKPLRLGF
jgi:competence protein ComEC